MKQLFAFASALSMLAAGALPAGAGDVLDVVRANCTKQIAASTNATRDEIKDITITKHGSGYVMGGHDAAGENVSCETDGAGVVKWVHTR